MENTCSPHSMQCVGITQKLYINLETFPFRPLSCPKLYSELFLTSTKDGEQDKCSATDPDLQPTIPSHL